MTRFRTFAVFAASVCLAISALGADIDRKDLLILGLSLEVDSATVVANSGIPAAVQTRFGGKINDDAPPDNGMTAVGELSGPGIDTPIRLVTKPGHLFQLPLLYEKGDYVLGNIRLVSSDGKTLQTAVPSFANITITQILSTQLSVHQLTPDELRARGITVDATNYDVFEYTFLFAINGQTVSVPYPVIIDKRTHEVVKAPSVDPYSLPPLRKNQSPPRFQPPTTFTFTMDPFSGGGAGGAPPAPDPKDPQRVIPAIPAAIVIPSGFGVLHQFFAVILNVGNSAPAGSTITLDEISATLDAPLGLRLAKTTPAVTIGQAVPVVDEKTGARFLIAAAQGSAEWSLEALKAGTHTVAVHLRATYKAPNQPDTLLKGNLSASFVVSDPRFQVNFVHPETIRAGEEYTAYAFITNTSATAQTVRIDPGQIPTCIGETSWSSFNVCFPQPMDPVEGTIERGKTLTVPYHLKSRLTGNIFASAGTADDNIKVGVSLSMGVSASGIPLSPATLLMPWYTRYVDPDFVAAQMTLFGLGYSLATAPLNDRTALLPRVIPNDIFRRAQDVARAGERIFIRRADPNVPQPLDDRDPLFDLSLDLLGNVERAASLPFTPDLKEWDELRRSEVSGRSAAAAMARQLERVGLSGGKNATDFANDFASSTAHRSPYLLAIAHGATVSGSARPYAMSVTGQTSQTTLAVPAEAPAPWTRTMPFAELMQFHPGSEYAELAMIGRFSESVRIDVVPASSDFAIELIYPAATDGSTMRASFRVTSASPSGVSFVIDRGTSNIIVTGGAYVPISGPSVVSPATLAIAGAAQDLHLNSEGRTVSLLLNRPIDVADTAVIRDLVTLTTDVTAIGYHARRRNDGTHICIPGAALQADGRILDVYFDKTLSRNAAYTIALDDSLLPGAPPGSGNVHPRIDNVTPSGLLYGKVLLGDNTPLASAPVELQTKRLSQFDIALDGAVTGNANDTGRYLFEYIPRDDNNGLTGTFHAQTSTANALTASDGIIRSPGELQQLNLVFIGRGTVNGFATYSDGRPLAGAKVVAGSAGYNNPLSAEMKTATSGANGAFSITDLPVGPFTLSVSDADGNVTFAANQIHSPGEVLRQDLVIHLRPFPGTGTVRVTVRRSDIDAADPHSLVSGAHVGVFTQGYGLVDGFTDAAGHIEFTKIPAGTISILAADFDITRQSEGVEVDLHPDSTIDQTLTLNVPTPVDLAARATLSGTVSRDDPFNPTSVTPVAGAIVTIKGFASVTAGPDGRFTYEGIPLSLAGKQIVTAFDPSTGRSASFSLPTQLVAGANALNMVISSTQPQGAGTMRVRLFDSAGQLVPNYNVMIPGFPETRFTEIIETPGIYELANIAVPRSEVVLAIPNGIDARYGDQTASGRVTLDFIGQTATLDLRLPGQGTVIAHLGCAPGVTECNIDVHSPVTITYRVFDEAAQEFTPQDRRVDPDANGVLTIAKVPVNQPATVATFENPLGYASAPVEMDFQGQQKDVFLVLTTTSSISGRVLNWDRQTPIAGAMVHLEGGAADLGSFPTAADGTFRISGVAANQQIRVIAEYSIDGIYRTGSIDTHTPLHGGPVGNLVVILQEQASVEGTIVDGNGAVVPLARYWARELSWPYQTHGSFTAPLSADRNGHFVISNVFQGGIHISAQSPQFSEQRGEFQGSIAGEANNLTGVRIVVGAGGTGTITVTVFDVAARVANAEATLLRNGATFDFGQSDGNGIVTFDNVPVGSDYTVRVISRARARAGSSGSLTVAQGLLTSVDIGLSVLGVVSGTLVDTESSPERLIVGGHITLQSGNVSLRSTTDATGSYRFDGVPEGQFTLSGFDFESGRSTTIPPPAFVLTSTIQELIGIKLTLEPTATLNVQVFLPNDAGGPGAAAPLVDAVVSQGSRYLRTLQGSGSGLAFPKLFASAPYAVAVTELGGEGRTVAGNGSFAAGATTGTIALTFVTSGSVQITVTSDDPSAAALIASASVTISAGGKVLTLFPDANGNVTAAGVPLGNVSATATSQGLSASASGVLNSRTVPLHLTLSLGRRISMAGHVEAEAGVGQPSVNTRVLAQVSSNIAAGGITIETRTDSNGNYSITGVPVGGTSVRFDFYGPDGATRGATRTVAVPDGTIDSYPAPNVKLDSTSPRVVSIDPANNANSVAPNSPITITFTEPLAAASVSTGNFRVIASDDSQAAPVLVTTETTSDGQFRVRLSPTVLLKSNMTYTIAINDTITDLSGNKMTLAVTTNFTTVDYTEPRVVSTNPTTAQPVGDGTTFYLHFNKAIDGSVFSSGGSGTLRLEQLTGNHGAVTGSPLPISVFVDPTSASTLVVAPVGVALQPAAFYRITINGARDTLTPPNIQTAAQTFDYFSADHIRPVVTIDAPSAATKLISGVDYVVTVSIVDEGTIPPHTSTDISYLQWFDGTGKALTRSTVAPYGYVLRIANGVTTATLKASAADLSGNVSDIATQTWDVTPNLPPQNIAIAVPASTYVARSVALSATFDEDGLAVTSALTVTGKHIDGTPYVLDASRIHRVSAQPIRRNTTSDAWTNVQYSVDVPADVKEADTLQFALTLTDADNQSSTKTASVNVLADTNAPVITSMLPAGETHYKFGDVSRNKFRAQVSVTDAESGVAHVTFVIDGKTTDVIFGATGSTYTGGVYTFFVDVDVTAKNVDTRVHVTATAFDYDGNHATLTTDVIYDSVNDGTAPMVWWLTPLDGALVDKGNITLTLRARATDDIHVDTLTFDSPLFASVTADRLANDVFQKQVTFDTPADGSSFTISATASDSGHQTVVPITIDQIVPDVDLATDAQINNSNLATYAGKTVRIHGAGKKLYISAPITLQNLIIADGAMAGNPDGTKIDVTVRDRLYVDGDSLIDVTGKGYLGGWASHESGGQNASPNGVTFGNVTVGGAAPPASGSFFASGSYGGLGGADAGASTNAIYGSITAPSDFGSGGSGASACCSAGGNGGGAVKLQGGSGSDLSRFVIAGAIHADGLLGTNAGGAGSGGSINLHARSLVAGWATRITANGGDDDGSANTSRGGGGGRIAAIISDRFDIEPTQPLLQARGGRNDSATETRVFVDGGAGTVFVQKPGEANGELVVSSSDERHASSSHLTRATPLATSAGTLVFDSIAIGPRALARFDDDYTANAASVSVDASAVLLHPNDQPSAWIVTAPPAGTSFIQGGVLPLTYSAQSSAGVGEVRAMLTPVADVPLPSYDYPSSISAATANIAIPTNAPAGSAALKLRVTDRAGRAFDTPSTSYTIVANTAPKIDQFDVTPASLQLYAGHPITVVLATSDDLGVTALTLTASTGTITPVTPTPNPAMHGLLATSTITIPPATVGGTVVLITVTATDGNGFTATQTKSVTILHDTNAPAVTASAPATVQEGSGATFNATATITDAEVGVVSAYAAFEGKQYPMTLSAGTWTTVPPIPVPNVDGTVPVPKALTVVARDYEGNIGTSAALTINVLPLIDAAGPTIDWLCASPGAVYPAGVPITLRVSATGASPANGVQSVQVFVDELAPVNATAVGNNVYETTITPAAGATSVSVRVVATSVASNSNDVLTTITLDATPVTTTNLTIDATNTTYDGTKSLLVGSGATVTITGPHGFRNLAVLDGGTLRADSITADRFFVACNGAVDVSRFGYTRNTSYPGAAAPANTSGGGHLGRGGKWDPMFGSSEGSVYRPQEAGGGGNSSDASANVSGGGAIHVVATTSAAVDGIVRANGGSVTGSGGGAGGSVWISTAGRFAGAGSIEARGGDSDRGAGSGGAVALEYDTSSGLLFNNIVARGGSTTGGTGTIYLRGTSSTFGDLTIDAKGLVSGITELPSFGSATVTSIPNSKTALLDSLYVAPYFAGHYLQVSAADGTPRGTWRIASVTNGPSMRAFGGFATIHTQDAVAYDGYLLYSDHGYSVAGQSTPWIAARFNAGQWQYDNDTTFVNFTPDAGDRVFASFSKSATAIASVTPIACCAPVNGVPTVVLVSGELLANVNDATGQVPFSDASEFMLRPDASGSGVVLAAEPARVTLEDATGSPVDVRAGDRVRGVYQFDHLTVAGARVQTNDLLLVTNPITADATSKIVTSNSGAPVIDISKVSFVPGLNGALLVGSAGAVTDLDIPVQVMAHNLTRGGVPSQTFALQNAQNIATGATGGFSIARMSAGTNAFGDSGASSIDTLTQGYTSFRASQTDRNLNAGFVVDDTTRDRNDPSQNVFHLRSDSQWEVWAAGATTSSASGSYSTSTLFRIEKSASAIRWFVDSRKVFELTTGVPAAVRFDVAFAEYGAEVNSIILDRTNIAQSVFTAQAAADGSFSMPVEGTAGDAFALAARDAHAYPATSAEITIGSFPNTIGVASVALQPATVAGGAKTTATVTLLQAAGSGGAFVVVTTSNSTLAPVPASITIPPGSTSASFTITTPSVATQANATISAAYAGTLQSATLNVVHDANPPTVTITKPLAGATITEGQSIAVEATIVDAEVGVKQAAASIDGVSYPMTLDPLRANVWTASVVAPDVDPPSDVPKQITVTASDFENNQSSPASVTVNIHPIIDALAPTLSWICGNSSMYPAGANATVIVKVTPASGDSINAVSIVITGPSGSQTFPMTLVSGNYQYAYAVPSAADGTVVTLRAVATTFAGKTNGLTGALTIIGGTAATFTFATGGTINAADTQYENGIIIVTGGTLTIAGAHHFARLAIVNGATVVHPATVGTTVSPLDITATTLYIACSSAIDVTGRGYAFTTTYPGATLPGNGSGGSHIGTGGLWDPPAASTFGSVYQPQEAGGGGESTNGLTGGGVVRIKATSITLDGAIRADGPNADGQSRGGAAGSIWISTTSLGGAGDVSARGSHANYGGGAGGAIAIEYGSGTSVPWTLTAKAGSSNGSSNGTAAGGAGTIYLHGPQAVYGDLTVDNNGLSGGGTNLPSLGAGVAQAGTSGAALVTDRATSIPAYFAGNWVEIRTASGTLKGAWRIDSIDTVNLKKVILKPNAAETIDLLAGDVWRGIYRFDSVTITGSILIMGDRLDSTNAPLLLNGATIVGNNQGPPVVLLSRITLGSGTLGPMLAGTAGAVADADQPITVFALNSTTGQTFSSTAAADGSFTVFPRGSSGDSISVFAKDANVFPLQSQPLVVGTLSSGSITPAAIPITTAMTADANFHARRLAFDGNKLVVQTAGNDNNKVLVFDLSTGSPVWTQTITVPVNVRDIVVKNDIAYVAGGNLYAYDLSVNPATQALAPVSCTDSYSVAVDGVYAYASSACGDGHIEIYDITNPKVPVRLRNQSTSAGTTYRQLIPYGNYLIGISPDGGAASGSDVVMLDRRDINNLVKVWEAKIAGFSGLRGSLQGTTLYVNSIEGAVAVIDVSVPTLGVVKSVYQVGTSAHGMTAVGTFAFVAADVAGVAGVNATDPANPSGAGSVATSPQAAWDVVIRGQLGIIAADDRLLTFTAPVQPQLNASKISMSFDGYAVTVQGTSASILGGAPLTCEVRDDTSSAKVSGVTVAANGSFSAAVTAAPGDSISIVATDANGLKSATVQLGIVPFGIVVQAPTLVQANNGNFRARHMAIEGTTLAVVNYPIGGTDTNTVMVFGIGGASPVLSQVFGVPGNTRDIAVRNGVAYVAGANLYAYDLSVVPAAQQQAAVSCGDSYSVAVDGVYAYVGSACGDGHIEIYDITNPKVPVRLRNQATGVTGIFTQLIPYGNYLIGVTPSGGSSGTDVVVIDRRDINNLVKVSATTIPGITGFRGAVSGQRLYVAGDGSINTMAVVDLSNVASPTFVMVPTVSGSRGVAVTGNVAAFGDGTPGVTFFDVTNPSAPRLIGTQNVGGMTWDVLFARGNLYAAAEQSIAVINGVAAPPIVDVSRVAIVRGSTATVSGSAGAITGAVTPVTAQVRNATSNVTGSSVTVAADGSFSATVAGTSGDVLSLAATDALGVTTTINLGIVPFGTVVQAPTLVQANNGNFRARHMAIDGSTLAVVNYPISGTDTNTVMVFNIGGASPVVSQVFGIPGNTRDIAVKNGVAYVAGGNLYAYDLSVNPAAQQQAAVSCGDSYSVAVDGVYAYVGSACGDGHIEIYDITNPKVPVRLRNQATGVTGIFTQLIPYGNYLIGVTPSGGASGTDVVVIDRHDINNLVKVSATTIPGITGFRGAVSGQRLYVTGDGSNATMAVVDLSNVASPSFAMVPTVGGSRGVAVAGNLAAIGDGTPGVTFFDVTNPATPRLIGTQNVGGMTWDVVFAGGKLYAASEQVISVIDLSGAGGFFAFTPMVESFAAVPPREPATLRVDRSRVNVEPRRGVIMVRGSRGALTGPRPISIDVRNVTLGTSVPVVPVSADGSFEAAIGAAPGDHLILEITSGAGEQIEIDLGGGQ